MLNHFKNLVYTWSTTQLGAYWEGFSGSYLPPPITSATASQFPVTTKAHVSRYRVRKLFPGNFPKWCFENTLDKTLNRNPMVKTNTNSIKKCIQFNIHKKQVFSTILFPLNYLNFISLSLSLSLCIKQNTKHWKTNLSSK